MDDFLGGLGGGGFGAALGMLYQKFMTDRKLEKYDDSVKDTGLRVNNLELYSARTYVTREDLKTSIAPITEGLRTINAKLDHLDEKINNARSALNTASIPRT